MNMELVCSTTHLNQETTRHSAAKTDENTLCNAVAEWETEEIIWTCVWKASEEHSAVSHSVLSWASVKTCHFQKKMDIISDRDSYHGITSLLFIWNRKETQKSARGGKQTSKQIQFWGWVTCLQMWKCLPTGLRGRVTKSGLCNNKTH